MDFHTHTNLASLLGFHYPIVAASTNHILFTPAFFILPCVFVRILSTSCYRCLIVACNEFLRS
jgi:hypothetical protein